MCERCVDRVIALYYPPSIRASVQKRKDRSSGYALSVIVVLNSDEEGGGRNDSGSRRRHTNEATATAGKTNEGILTPLRGNFGLLDDCRCLL